ncbi:MAG TPA: hypothetical protein VG389_24010, partial [Myxococcota bacterium]|nr:hypothetical protein [Myxococcota bacterium]
VDQMEQRYQKKVTVQPNKGFHFEHFELHGQKEGGRERERGDRGGRADGREQGGEERERDRRGGA